METVVLENLSKRFGTGADVLTVLSDINLRVPKGEFVSIVGPSGCGKTTLLEILAGLQRPDTGSVTIEGESVSGPNRSVGVVFQEESTFPWRTVRENVAFGLEMRGASSSASQGRVNDVIDLVGLGGFGKYYPYQLSGGMKQRVAIARTLVMEPSVIALDEPFGALDEQTRLRVGLELLNIVRAAGSTTILITHSIQEAALLSDRIVVMTHRPGRIGSVVTSDLEPERGEHTLTTDEFSSISQTVWRLLMDQDEQAGAGPRDSSSAA